MQEIILGKSLRSHSLQQRNKCSFLCFEFLLVDIIKSGLRIVIITNKHITFITYIHVEKIRQRG